jgi:TetR/AcrR family transcriptional repressor of nem operon
MSTKEDILKLAGRELQIKGIHSLSFRELASALGIKSSSIHYHFPQKDDLIQMLILNYSNAVFGGIEKLRESEVAGRDRLLAAIDMIGNSLETRQCTAGILAAESYQISDRARAHVSAFIENLTNWIQSELKEMGKTQSEVEVLASVIVAAIEGSLMIDCLNQRSEKLTHLRQFIEMI